MLEQDARRELMKIMDVCTLEELKQLNFKGMYFDSTSESIYGQLTGDMFSPRSAEIRSRSVDHLIGDRGEEIYHEGLYSLGVFRTPLEHWLKQSE